MSADGLFKRTIGSRVRETVRSVFNVRPSPEKASKFLAEAVANADIEPRSEKGQYVAFLIFLDCTFAQFKPCAVQPKAAQTLMKAVEHRIRARDFVDPAAEFDLVQISRHARHWEPNLLARRIIVVKGGKSAFMWEFEIGDDGKEKLSILGYED